MSLHPAIARMGGRISYGTRLNDAITIDRLNGIMDAVTALAQADAITAGPGLKAINHGGKTVLDLARRPRGGGGTSVVASVAPFDAKSINPTSNTVSFHPGTINGMLPTNWATTFSFSPGQANYVYLACEANSGAVASAMLQVGVNPPLPIGVQQGYPQLNFNVVLGILSSTGSWLRAIGPSALTAKPIEVLRTEKPTYAPGEFPFNLFYSWEVSSE